MAGMRLMYSYLSRNLQDDGVVSNTSPTFLSLIKSPFLVPFAYTDDGTQLTNTLNDVDVLGVSNPNAIIANAKNTDKHYRFGLSIAPVWDICKMFSLDGRFSYQLVNTREHYFSPMTGVSAVKVDGNNWQNTVKDQSVSQNSIYADFNARFHNDFNLHHVEALRDINENNISADNTYLKEREYYALLNNCNYYIQRLDTAVTHLESGRPVKYLRPYMAQAKAIRAWTYLNLCLDYGSVRYTTQPILDSEASETTTETLGLDQLLPLLISDLEGAEAWLPAYSSQTASNWVAGYADPGFTSSVNYESYAARQLMFPLRFVLGELYMWSEDFAKAAQAYYDLIYMDQLKMAQYRNLYDATGTTVTRRAWSNQFSGFSYQDILTAIVFDRNNAENRSQLYAMANTDYTIAPSEALIDDFNSQFYYTNRAISGDLRGLYGTYRLRANSTNANAQDAYITKYGYMTASSNYYVAPCRAALIWLRYAEAVNRLGKPKLAFNGFLKYGLSAYNINLYRDRDALSGEITGEPWMNFGQDNPDGTVAQVFSSNTIGFHGRGCGNTDMNEAYAIEEQPTLQDSILWVEDQLVTEYALETALEGNRFHDLMRISRYRNDPSYLASKVSGKFTDGQRTAVYNRLLDRQNWYLPEEK